MASPARLCRARSDGTWLEALAIGRCTPQPDHDEEDERHYGRHMHAAHCEKVGEPGGADGLAQVSRHAAAISCGQSRYDGSAVSAIAWASMYASAARWATA